MLDFKKFRELEFLRREKHLKDAKKQRLELFKNNHRKLHIVYVMTHVGICGGSKIIFEHVNHLVENNQKATIVSHFNKPSWFPINDKVKYIKVPFNEELALGIPPCDVIVATYWREIYECITREIAPVVYFEQGDYHLFMWDNVKIREKEYIYKQYKLVPFIYTVSQGAAELIYKIFGKYATVINNAIDNRTFYNSTRTQDEKDVFTLMMIGSEKSKFKGISDIKKAVYLLSKMGYKIKLNWVTPDEPIYRIGNVEVNPEQSKIGSMLRSSDIFICASYYESFSLPVLEAMACGCAVITTKTTGVEEYAQDGKNCIMTAMGNSDEIAENIIRLIKNSELRNKIIDGGLKTASNYTWNNITPKIIEYYRMISCYKPVKNEDVQYA